MSLDLVRSETACLDFWAYLQCVERAFLGWVHNLKPLYSVVVSKTVERRPEISESEADEVGCCRSVGILAV